MPSRPQPPWWPDPPDRLGRGPGALQARLRRPSEPRQRISYYRYGLPFYIVHEDATAAHGERFESLNERKVAEMWTHPEGLEKHPLYVNYMDYGPEDRHKTFPNPALWMFGRYLPASRGTGPKPEGAPKTINPFAGQFARYFPDLRTRRVEGGPFSLSSCRTSRTKRSPRSSPER